MKHLKVMNKEQQDIILDVYREHCLEQSKYLTHGGTIQEFINKIKTDDKFSEKWELKIEERELSFNERYELCKEKTNKNPLKYSDENGNYPEHIQKPVLKLMESENIPTKLITLEYNGIKTESYE